MRLFTSASGFQINGGTFFESAGDMTIIHTAQTIAEQNISSLEFVAEGPSRELPGVERNDGGFGATRMAPYDEDPWVTFVASGPSLSNSPPFTFPPQEHEFNSQHFLGSFSATHTSQDITAGYHEQFYESMNSTGSEHPLSSFAPVAGTPGGFSGISSYDNPFGLTLTGHVPNPFLATEIFSEEMQPRFRPSLHLPTIVDVSNLGPSGELALQVISSVAGTNLRPWDD
ncbi:hypothetical protein B0H13DRAFT_1905435 [Mycena leptocephala]|nr:hypothetical protein B0H13DRAFT_1905435 [Mycena leptocephala]